VSTYIIEQNVIGMLLKDKEQSSYIIGHLNAEMFTEPIFQEIFESVLSLIEANKVIDVNLINNILLTEGKTDTNYNHVLIQTVDIHTISKDVLKSYIETMVGDYNRRLLTYTLQEVNLKLLSGADVSEAGQTITNVVSSISSSSFGSNIISSWSNARKQRELDLKKDSETVALKPKGLDIETSDLGHSRLNELVILGFEKRLCICDSRSSRFWKKCF